MLRHATQRLFGAASAPARSQFKPVVTRPQNKLSAPNVVRVPHAGVSVLQDPTSNKGTGFSTAERDRLRIRGLVPPAYTDLAGQMERVMRRYRLLRDDLSRYSYLINLQDRNEVLFYKVLATHLRELAPIIYTPTVGLACQQFGEIFRRPRGMYFSRADRGEMASMVYNWPHTDVEVIVVTDGSRILGLGDLGVNGMGIPIGKLSLYAIGAGINPSKTLPVVLDVGTNNLSLLNDSLYLGLRHKRTTGDEYFEIVDEFMSAVRVRWPNALVQFEDFASIHAIPLLEKYRHKTLCFNDDIQGTGTVALAAVLSSLRARGKKFIDLKDERILVVGAGSAGVGVSTRLRDFNHKILGMSKQDAAKNIYLMDQYGVCTASRLGSFSASVAELARASTELDNLSILQVIQRVKPTILIGLSGQGGIFTESIIREMKTHNERPVIFPMSNPTLHTEVSASNAFLWTEGTCIYASGSPFESVTLNGKVCVPNQCNNMFVYPGIGLGVLACRAWRVSDGMFQAAARALAECVTEEDLAAGLLFPQLEFHSLRKVSRTVAAALCEQAEREGIATIAPASGDWGELIDTHVWNPEYAQLIHHETD
eukprot:TRINITY_DN5096_c0_g1_i4.p1 TRINITY_DN5096_c0_g1~~TRINITY_DN5096_c0_g1_i4.p1  ORF type:complete len:602 (-),score=146.61 TRINITY_DN5096_c0_g1_i4:20-1804(-)